jgi:hypothetical protein
MPRPRKDSLSVTIPPDILTVVRHMADQQDRSVSYLVGEALREYVAAHYRPEPVAPQPVPSYTTGTTL